MKQLNLHSKQRIKHHYRCAEQKHHTFENKLNRQLNSTLTSDALKMAYTVCLQPKNILFYSDQGTYYTSQQFAQSIAQCTGMQHSMSRKGNCWDNAPTERFFRSFKSEWMPKKGYTNRIQAQQDIADYILGYYSSIRPHQFNEYLSPLQKERLFFSHGS